MSTKDAGLRIRVERELREAFIAACQGQGLVASEVLREFMKTFAGKHRSEQAVLFGNVARQPSGAASGRASAKRAK